MVTGGGGYVGSILIKKLLQSGFEIICLDRFFFGMEPISKFTQNSNFSFIQDDIRWFDKNILKNVDCVLDLASISNDPAGELDPKKTLEINYDGRVRVAKLSKEMGVKKYVLASTCSVYGFDENICTEENSVNPLTTYAKASALAEKEILKLSTNQFSSTSLRFATIYGLSKRMRFDLVVNTMTLSLFQSREIILNGGGEQQRPLVNINDAVNAYLCIINNPADLINGQIFNVGSDVQNYKMKDLAIEIGAAVDKDYTTIKKGEQDFRSYVVSFKKIKEELNYNPKVFPQDSSKEIFSALSNNLVDFGTKSKTVEWYKILISDKKLSSSLLMNGNLL